jgi:hypothetical protein
MSNPWIEGDYLIGNWPIQLRAVYSAQRGRPKFSAPPIGWEARLVMSARVIASTNIMKTREDAQNAIRTAFATLFNDVDVLNNGIKAQDSDRKEAPPG